MSVEPDRRSRRRWRLWASRLSVAVVVPCLLLALMETGLRVFGYGVPTGFVFEQKVDGQDSILSNPYFAWKFFPPQMARECEPFLLSLRKGEGTYRIFLLGGSAAMGDPEPAYGMGRILELMLRDRYPGVNIEVVNTAMPAINSHAVYAIASACRDLEPDLFVIYMGNNEVVGPYGVGTVFSPLEREMWMIRASVAAKSSRTGQLVRNTIARFTPTAKKALVWDGMEMFLDSRVRGSHRDMNRVYAHFERNLVDICRVAREADVPVVLSTIGVNLRDSAPFASLHRSGLSEGQSNEWHRAYRKGVELQEKGKHQEAIQRYLASERIDADYAELHFRLGRCYAAQTNHVEARVRYVKAMELDTLRFRADTRINAIIRRVGDGEAAEG
ncbi:MAG: tetratricopeptide repeat protein, partial [Lentisphaerae bacterium]|nr:tetratricopeptide repeat protein [Lentisphaerota bacterium]